MKTRQTLAAVVLTAGFALLAQGGCVATETDTEDTESAEQALDAHSRSMICRKWE